MTQPDDAVGLLNKATEFNASLIEVLRSVGVTPRAPTIEQRGRVGLYQEEVAFSCDRCHEQWPNLRVDGQLRRGWWQCPNGCNAKGGTT